jgi:hypothetical protein
MTRLNWDKDRRRHMVAESAGKALRDAACQEWATIHAQEQRRYRQIAKRYSDVNSFCRDIASQIADGRPVSQPQAAVLMKIQSEQDRKRSDEVVARGKRRTQEALA